jgi:hypothetical protein
LAGYVAYIVKKKIEYKDLVEKSKGKIMWKF